MILDLLDGYQTVKLNPMRMLVDIYVGEGTIGRRTIATTTCAVFCLLTLRSATAGDIDFDHQIAPILARSCFDCHGPDESKREAGLRLDLRDSAMGVLESGKTAIVAGDLARSELMTRITSGDDDVRMPPPDSNRGLSPDEIDLLRRWILQGADWRTHWSFNPLQKVAVPMVSNGDWTKGAIDRFILARLEDAGIAPARKAGRFTLVRRLYFDLIGLPPTPDELRRFVDDRSPDAYERLVDRLLASPHYGERWGRHWLDIARYGDSNGGDSNDTYAHAYRYRDWVLGALNRDMPYDRFVALQIAGDLLSADPELDRNPVAATGFLAIGTKIIIEKDLVKMRVDQIAEQINTLGKALLGLSVACARCHDHKFDPISTGDYYALAGIFQSTQVADYAKSATVAEGEAGNARIHRRGSHLDLGPEVDRGFIKLLAGGDDVKISNGQSGRLQLARWLTDPSSPAAQLAARVIVNRIWHWHFGQGIVATLDDLGTRGSRPTHPRLLDHLAARLIDDGWSLKRLHRRIVTPATYRMTSTFDSFQGRDLDPANRLLWKQRRRRLEAEAIRDAMLLATGNMDLRLGGKPVEVKTGGVSPEQLLENRAAYDGSRRRSVYLPVIRTNVYRFLTLFDFPNAAIPVGRRSATTIPTQALFMMNSPLLAGLSEQIAERALSKQDAGMDRERIEYLVLSLYSREASEVEVQSLQDFLAQYQDSVVANVDSTERTERAWRALCHVLLTSNEFVYLN